MHDFTWDRTTDHLPCLVFAPVPSFYNFDWFTCWAPFGNTLLQDSTGSTSDIDVFNQVIEIIFFHGWWNYDLNNLNRSSALLVIINSVWLKRLYQVIRAEVRLISHPAYKCLNDSQLAKDGKSFQTDSWQFTFMPACHKISKTGLLGPSLDK